MLKFISTLASAGATIFGLMVVYQLSLTDFLVADNFAAAIVFAFSAMVARISQRYTATIFLAFASLAAWVMDIFVLPIKTLSPYPLVVSPFIATFGPLLPFTAGLTLVAALVAARRLLQRRTAA